MNRMDLSGAVCAARPPISQPWWRRLTHTVFFLGGGGMCWVLLLLGKGEHFCMQSINSAGSVASSAAALAADRPATSLCSHWRDCQFASSSTLKRLLKGEGGAAE